MGRLRGAVALLAGALLATPGITQEQTLANWFDDPFVQASDEVANCPPPLGPFSTEAERRTQAHHRAEKGTTCFLTGACAQPSFYARDKAIAAGALAALREAGLLRRSSLRVTVQGRVVFVEGCVGGVDAGPQIERAVRKVPEVLQVLAVVYVNHDDGTRPPYRVVPPRHR